MVKENDTVLVHYEGTLHDGEVFDSSKEKDPLKFKVNSGQVIPGFDAAVLGMGIDETKKVTIPATEAYGEINNELIFEVTKEQLSDSIKPEVGMQLTSQDANGQPFTVMVTEINETSIMVDANHPLAGKDLTFELTLVEIL